jgi:signal transduction histidine kinase
MTPPRPARKPTFLWQGLLILLPVALLAVVGLSAIRQDRAAVRQEARQRAQELLSQMAEGVGWRASRSLADFDAFAQTWFEHYRVAAAAWPDNASRRAHAAATQLNYQTEFKRWQAAWPGLVPDEVLPTTFVLNETGELISPVPCPRPPEPPAWVAALSAQQRHAWAALRQAEHLGKDPATIDALVNAFIGTNPAREAERNAAFIRQHAQPASAAPAESLTNLLHYADPGWDVRTESGVPLPQIALAEALDRVRQVGFSEPLWRWIETETFDRPSVLIPPLLDRLAVLVATNTDRATAAEALKTAWNAQERLRELAELIHDHSQSRGPAPCSLWLDNVQGRWLCLLTPNETNRTTSDASGRVIQITNRTTEVWIYPKAVVARAFALAISRTKNTLPAYLAISVDLAGQRLDLGPQAGGVPRSEPQGEVLAEAGGVLAMPGTASLNAPPGGAALGVESGTRASPARFELRLALADPGLLFARQRQRQLIFGAMIGVSALAALVGYVAARRAFQRQLRLSELKSNFVSSVSHELRAPLASVRLMAESLERGKVGEAPKQQEYFKFIVQECRRLSSLIENVLDFSRIEQGRKHYEFEPTDLLALVQQTVKLMQTYAAERNVSLSLRLPALVADANLQPSLDGKAIQQALVNLIDNAVKHSPAGGSVTVGLEVHGSPSTASVFRPPSSALPPPSCLHLYVEDAGCGIPLAEQEKIFERFYRPGSELRRQTQGVGIGLSIVKHIVEAHAGQVHVRSAPGQGSRFTIELPEL